MIDEKRQAIVESVRGNLAAARRLERGSVPETPQVTRRSSDSHRGSVVEQFSGEIQAVGGRVFHSRTTEGAREYIREVVQRQRAERVAISTATILRSLAVESLLHQLGRDVIPLPKRNSFDDLEDYKRRLMTADLGITGARYGLADSGTLILQTGATEGRLASLVPPVHLALIRADDILPDVTTFITKLGQTLRGSDLILITGPSRTADIELTLTMGVHGPKALHVLILDSP